MGRHGEGGHGGGGGEQGEEDETHAVQDHCGKLPISLSREAVRGGEWRNTHKMTQRALHLHKIHLNNKHKRK